MPDVDGPRLYLWIKNAYPELLERIVFITGGTPGPSNRSFLEADRPAAPGKAPLAR